MQDLTHYEPKPSQGSIEVWLAHPQGRASSELRRVRAASAPLRLQPAGSRDWP